MLPVLSRTSADTPAPHHIIRFDFNLSRPLTPAEVGEVERLVNSWVADAAPTSVAEMALDAARAAGATAMFGEKYDDVVRVVSVPGVSMELCGGAWFVWVCGLGWGGPATADTARAAAPFTAPDFGALRRIAACQNTRRHARQQHV
jgi:hypothetical protein